MSFTEETISSLALNGMEGVGPAAIRDLIAALGSATAVLAAGPAAWRNLTRHAFDEERASADLSASVGRARADAENASRCGARIYLAHTGPYPRLLKQTACPPPVIYAIGDDLSTETNAVAIVGSRACTHYGEKVAHRLSQDLVASGVTTVSGLARGIDTRVHESTLAAGGSTWAVVGSGLLMTYPPENRSLAERIGRRGAVISEFPMATKPHPANFPRRNRIIAGLSAGTVVVEGGLTSGALITARLAAEEGRDVFAVPGPVTSPQSRAPHRLLRDGAILAESADDILGELGWRAALISGEAGAEAVEGTAGLIMEAVSDVPLERDALLARIAVDAKSAGTILVQLEMQGLIRTLPGGMLVRA